MMHNENDTGTESEESDDDALTSERRIPKLLIRSKIKVEKSCEYEPKWEILSNKEDADETHDLKHGKDSKDKVKSLG